MKAVLIDTESREKRLYLGDTDMPTYNEQQVLLRIKATALNRADLLQRQGQYPPPRGASEILGLEAAGEIAAVGEECQRFKVGDKVLALLPGGGYAQYASVDEHLVMHLPKSLDFIQAAGIPEVFLTGYQCLFYLGQIQPGDVVLLHAGASGIGTAVIQLARMAGAKIIITASSDEKLSACLDLGASLAINYLDEDWVKEIQGITNRRGCNLIIDPIGAPYFEKNLSCLSKGGRYVLMALLGGRWLEQFDLALLLNKHVSLFGTTLRSRSLDYQAQLIADFSRICLPQFTSEKLFPIIDSVYSWTDVEQAHARMANNENIGKIILIID